MTPRTFLFIGRSGCGKGTQAKLLMDALKVNDPKSNSVYIQTGNELRNFIKGDTYTQKLAKNVYDDGGLMPEFLTVYEWSKVLIERFSGREHLIFDGSPRRLHEAGVLHSIFGFFKLNKPCVILIDLDRDVAIKRLLDRKRLDDNKDDIEERMAWFETDVMPAINFYRDNTFYDFLVVDGNRSIEDIHADIVSKVGF
ncbi:MAG: nucleoside monophosphate kinase [Candidatus Paceibacterota bacterium]|jgi:adenylate kinase family enzyme